MDIPEIDVEELERRHGDGLILIDVREPDEYESGHVPGAVLIPLQSVPDSLAEIPDAGEIHLICASGGRSMHAAQFLAGSGRSTINIAGGTKGLDSGGQTRRHRSSGLMTPAVPSGSDHPRAVPMTGFELITTPAGVADVVAAARSGDAYALDTEFHRERTYFPKVALVQIAWEGGLVLIDPLATSLAPLAELLTEGGVAVIHAAGQDLEVLERACGCVPHTLFDTQLAAGFVGLRTPSLASILDRELGVRLPKGDRLTDWLVRPLTKAQLAYAAADVEHLLEVHRRLSDKLRQSGRLAWAAAESEELRLRTRAQRDPEQAWLRIKEVRHLNKKARGIAQSVGRWREEKAIATDQPPRFVLPDLAVIGVAQRAPTTVAQLRKIRGLDDRHARGSAAEEILAAVDTGRGVEIDLPRNTIRKGSGEDLRPAVTLISAWIGQYAKDQDLDPALLGTRSDIEALLRGDADARLASGWRNELAGGPIKDLLEGRAALAFSSGRLVLESRQETEST